MRDPVVGTYLTPEAAYIKEFITHLQRKCIETISRKALAEAHNALALYTMQMFGFATGHRAVCDPFFDIGTFDISKCIVLIEDKVVSASHHARIAWLPPIAIKQLEHYLSHLRSLSRFIRQQNSTLADQIWAVTEPDYPHPLPLFFFITEKNEELEWYRAQPATIENMLGSYWALPLNSNRHLLSTWLHRNGCPSELIDAQLGHIEAGCSPLSTKSALAPEMIGRIIIPYLEAYLKEQGWDAIKGLDAPSRLPIIPPLITSKQIKPTIIFGPEARATNKEAMWRNDAEAVLRLVKEALPSNSSNYSDESIDKLQDRIIEEAPEGRILIRLSIFRRHLIKLKRSGAAVKVPGRLAVANKEESCFNINASYAASKIDNIRVRFVNYLSSKSDEMLDQDRRIAEIIISSSIYGGRTSQIFLDALALGFRDCIYLVGNEVIVDVSSSPNSPIHRWMPDAISWSLILGYCKNLKGDSHPPSSEKVKQYIDEILLAIDAPRVKKRSPKLPVSKLLAPTLDLCKPYWRFILPGVIRGYAEGENSCASVPLSNWLRLITGKPGTVHSTSDVSKDKTHFDDIVPIRKFSSDDATYKNAKFFWDEISRALGPSAETKKSSNAEARSNAKKRAIEKNISDLLNDISCDTPTIAGLISAWALHLCRNGTNHKPNLRASSVVTYTRTIGERLIALAHEEDFLSASDLVIEDIYRKVLDSSSAENKGYVAARLKEFHSFLVGAYALPGVDWSEVIDDDLLEAEAVDAGLVTINEYERALTILSNDSYFSERDRLLHAVVLLFAYRFGLRTGEIFRLTISDVLLEDGEMIVYVRNSIFGETKTDNGIRQLPLIGTLNELEHGLISQWLAHVDIYADGDHLAALLPKLASQRTVVDRSSCVRIVVEALRAVTGDPQTRLRHLRHTCATRLFLAMTIDEHPAGLIGDIYNKLWGEVSPQHVRTILIGNPRLSRRGPYAMAMYMGHGSPDVTHRHYVHLADIHLKDWVNRIPVHVNDKALSYAYQTTYANVRKIRSREKSAPSTSLSEHFTRQSTIPTQKLHTYIQNSTPESNLHKPAHLALRPVDIDRLITIATMRDSIDGIADSFLTTGKMVAKVLLDAALLQESTGFTDFSIPQATPGDSWTPKITTRSESLEKESQRIRRFLHQIDQSDINVEQLKNACNIWLNSYHPYSTSLLINTRSDLNQILVALKGLGIPSEDFEVLIPDVQSEVEYKVWLSIKDELSSQGLSVSHKERLPVSSSRFLYDNRVGLILRASKSHPLGYQRTLNRALFVTSVWLKVS